jgi:DNA-binding protein H-NS
MVTVKDIEAKIAKLRAQAEAMTKKEMSAAVTKIRDLMQQYGVTTADLEPSVTSGRTGRVRGSTPKTVDAVIKYRDPKTGAGWSGRGRAPAWIANAKNRDRFLVSDEGVDAGTTRQPKAGNYVRGPQAPKYRDPDSGATWSGRGKAPAWFALAKDRSAYLINTGSKAHGASKAKKAAATGASKAAGKKVVTTKRATKKVATKAATKKAPSKKAPSKTTKGVVGHRSQRADSKITARKMVSKKKAAVPNGPGPDAALGKQGATVTPS